MPHMHQENILSVWCKENGRENIVKEWDTEKNGPLTDKVSRLSSDKVWWKCEKGHEWKTSPLSRTYINNNCPICSNRKILVGYNDLATTHPKIAAQFHPTKNGHLTAQSVVAGSAKVVWWKCEKGHEWQRSIRSRTSSRGLCPVCDNLAYVPGFSDFGTKYPELLVFWDYEKNGDLDPYRIGPNYWEKVHWKCPDCQKEWEARIGWVLKHPGCPWCSDYDGSTIFAGVNDLATLFPHIAEEWDYEKNGDVRPDEIGPNYAKRVWWKCKRGHSWQATPNSRTNNGVGRKCMTCYQMDREKIFFDEDFEQEWDTERNGPLPLNPSELNHANRYWWKCSNGHRWSETISGRIRSGCGCVYCKGKQLLSGFNDLQTVNPALAADWHPFKNEDLLPNKVLVNSNKLVWWKCPSCGHEWQDYVVARHLGRECPKCGKLMNVKGKFLKGLTDLASTHPEIAAMWHPTKNGNLKPCDVSFGSGRKVWWIDKDGKEEYRRIIGQVRKFGEGAK